MNQTSNNIPKTFDEAVQRLVSDLPLKDKTTIANMDEGDLITSDVIDTVNTLRTLRHFIREVARREEIRHIVKGSSEDSDVIKKSDEHNFAMLVDDVDMVCACVMYIYYSMFITNFYSSFLSNSFSVSA